MRLLDREHLYQTLYEKTSPTQVVEPATTCCNSIERRFAWGPDSPLRHSAAMEMRLPKEELLE